MAMRAGKEEMILGLCIRCGRTGSMPMVERERQWR